MALVYQNLMFLHTSGTDELGVGMRYLQYCLKRGWGYFDAVRQQQSFDNHIYETAQKHDSDGRLSIDESSRGNKPSYVFTIISYLIKSFKALNLWLSQTTVLIF